MQRLCSALVVGRRGECLYPVVESSEISLCARHLLLAAHTVEDIGRPYLESIVRAEIQEGIK